MTTKHRQPEHRVDPTPVTGKEVRSLSETDLMAIHQQVQNEARANRSAIEYLKKCHAILVSRTGASLVGLVDLGNASGRRAHV